MKKIIFYLVFAIIILGVLFGYSLGLKWMDYVFKPMIMVWIACYFLDEGRKIDNNLKSVVLTAFAFSWAGDIFLMFSGISFIFFIIGLVSFLVSQLFYIISFRKSVQMTQQRGFISGNRKLIIPYILYGLIIFAILYNHLGMILKFSVVAYMTAIISMSIMALNRKNTVSKRSFFLIFIGSLLFIVSDSLLAINKFVMPVPFERFFVLGSYISAQYLIMRGILRQFNPASGK
jgi:uncharacterized membrane protein YhhN